MLFNPAHAAEKWKERKIPEEVARRDSAVKDTPDKYADRTMFPPHSLCIFHFECYSVFFRIHSALCMHSV